jgi:hypothetical protein
MNGGTGDAAPFRVNRLKPALHGEKPTKNAEFRGFFAFCLFFSGAAPDLGLAGFPVSQVGKPALVYTL